MEDRNSQGIKSRANANRQRRQRVQNAERNQRPRQNVEQRRTAHAADGQVRRQIPTSGTNEMRKRSVRMRKRKQTGCIITALLFVIMISVSVGAIYVKKFGSSSEMADLEEYYGLTKSNHIGVIIDNEVIGGAGMLDGETPYISYETVRDYLNSRFYWDSNENVLLYTLEDGTVRVDVGSSSYTKGQDGSDVGYTILKTDGQVAYIAAEFVKTYTNMDYLAYEADDLSPGRIVIEAKEGDIREAQVNSNSEVRYRGGVKSPILRSVEKNEVVTILEDEENWKKVCTTDGYVGYIKSSNLRSEKTRTISREFEEQTYSNISKDYIINMAWHQVTNATANSRVLEMIANTKGLTTIAPTWFFIDNTEGDIVSLASAEYVNYAHQSNIEVWAVLNDFDGGINSSDATYEVLSYTSKREKVINQVVAQALQAGIDGINVDIEKVSTACGEHYIQFIRELSVRCRQNNLVLSVDNYPPKSYNGHFNYEEQGIVADYVVIMGYDEHYSGSPEAGSVASINYVTEGITEMIKMVSPEKVINAIPFYTRLWKEVPKTQEELDAEADTEAANYPNKISSEALGMSEAKQAVSAAGVEAVWDEQTKQNFATWEADGATYKIWLEDAESIEAKLQVVKDNNLAGVSAWRLGFQEANIWNVIQKYVN